MTTYDQPSQDRLRSNWQAISAELDTPTASVIERLLGRVGLSSGTVRLMAGTPALRRAWFAALATAIVVGLSAADSNDPRSSLFAFFVVAPLVPLLGVSLAYGVRADPAHEITLATPMSGLRLVLLRSAVVVVVSATILGLASLLGPSPALMAGAWLLPALGLTALNLALMTMMVPRRASLAAAMLWLGTLVIVDVSSADKLAAFSPTAQLVAILLAVGSMAVVLTRRQAFDRLEATA